MVRSVIAALCLVLPTVPASADGFVDGLAAYDAGRYAETVRIWEPLAKAGDPLAQLGLAGLYRSGEGVPRDMARAAALYRKAARQGNGDAQINLARLLIDGSGIERDLVEAHAWLAMAAEAGRRWASERLATLEAEMTAEEIDAAVRRRAALATGD